MKHTLIFLTTLLLTPLAPLHAEKPARPSPSPDLALQPAHIIVSP